MKRFFVALAAIVAGMATCGSGLHVLGASVIMDIDDRGGTIPNRPEELRPEAMPAMLVGYTIVTFGLLILTIILIVIAIRIKPRHN